MRSRSRSALAVVMLAAVAQTAFGQAIYTLRRTSGAPASTAGERDARVLVDGIVTRRIGDDGLRRLRDRQPDSTAVARWDLAGLRRDTARLAGTYVPVAMADVLGRTSQYGSLPGGVTLEGVATGVGPVTTARYDARVNALILNDRFVYFATIPQVRLAALSRAIAADEKDRIGVTGSRSNAVFGALPTNDDLTWDLRMSDHFLSEFVFGENDWTFGYRMANGYRPQVDTTHAFPVAASCNFTDFVFRAVGSELRAVSERVELRVTPISRAAAPDSGFLPDVDRVARGSAVPAYEANARHLADNIAYYRRERLVDRVVAYGEAAALLRHLERAGFDLKDFAAHIPGGAAIIASRP